MEKKVLTNKEKIDKNFQEIKAVHLPDRDLVIGKVDENLQSVSFQMRDRKIVYHLDHSDLAERQATAFDEWVVSEKEKALKELSPDQAN